jgi:outer membrane protein assembly factor BamB
VYALDLATGKLRWEYQVNTQELGGPGPDGVAVADGRVYGDGPHTAFALSAATGKPLWVNTATGAIVYRHQLPTSTNAPLVITGNTVIVSAGGPLTGPPLTGKPGGGNPQIVAYTVR